MHHHTVRQISFQTSVPGRNCLMMLRQFSSCSQITVCDVLSPSRSRLRLIPPMPANHSVVKNDRPRSAEGTGSIRPRLVRPVLIHLPPRPHPPGQHLNQEPTAIGIGHEIWETGCGIKLGTVMKPILVLGTTSLLMMSCMSGWVTVGSTGRADLGSDPFSKDCWCLCTDFELRLFCKYLS